jgi:hypothetical protein
MARPPPSTTASMESISLVADDYLDMSAEDQQAVLRHCLKMHEQYKRSRDKLLLELSTQSEELERLQTEGQVLSTSLQVRRGWT